MPHYRMKHLPELHGQSCANHWTRAHEVPEVLDPVPAGFRWPRISIVTPSFNQASFLEKTIRSVLLQGYPDLEYIIIDGGSSDDSQDIIRHYANHLTYWTSEPDQGQSQAINKGFSHATGEIFHWLNSDDSLLPGALVAIAKMYRDNPAAAAWVGACNRVDAREKLLSRVVPRNLTRPQLADWSREGFFYQPACFFSSPAWQEVGKLDESLEIALDLDLWMRLSAWGEFVPTDQVLAEAIIHQDAKTRRRRLVMQAETIFIQVKYGYQDISAVYLNDLQNRHLPRQVLDRARNKIFAAIKKLIQSPVK